MASFSRGLCLVLTVAMAATRPSSAIKAGSSDSSFWWETKEFAGFNKTARALRNAGDFASLESVYTTGYLRAQKLGNRPAQISFLTNLGTARMLSWQYARALESYVAASSLAEQWKDWSALGGIAVNLSLVYQQVGDAEAALSALERGKAAVDRLPIPPPYMAQLLMRLRSVRTDLQDDSALPRYQDAIEAARKTDNPEAEAAAWDLLGKEWIAAGKLEKAESALGRALRLRSIHSQKSLTFSYAALGGLKLAQAGRTTEKEQQDRAKEARMFTDRALMASASGSALYMLLHQRGQIREVLGQNDSALRDFSAAVDQASEWSEQVPPAQSLMTGVDVGLQHQVYDSFVEAAARKALRTGNKTWAIRAFLALEANRAASLRRNRALAPVWKKKLPISYWETLAKLNQEEARDLRAGTVSTQSKSLHLALTEMESIAGRGVSLISSENFSTRSSLTHIQHGLGKADLLLSFYLGTRESYVWTVTQSGLNIHRLPAEGELEAEVRRFREALMSGQSTVADVAPAAGEPVREKLGADLYERLFSSLDSDEAGKTSWLLSLDGPLFELPFAALVSGYENGQPVYAVEQHSIQAIPGALFLSAEAPGVVAPAVSGGFLGVGDPVYNAADPRWKGRWSPWRIATHGPLASTAGEPHQLNRLVSTARELSRSSHNWHSDATRAGSTQILEGTAAGREAFLTALTQAPSTIHLATHVLTSATQPEQAFLAFSLDRSGKPGLLSTSEIGMLHVPGALVVMTGCATATGDVRPGVGLLGLTEAWIMAGAKTVVATNWPVPDADGDLIPAFYLNLRGSSAAQALRRSQVELIHSGTWQASPAYWAAFQVMGGGR
jgi:CHAT domain-containing protein/tetratricopeptide (TPR) repeat protein